MLGRVKVFCGVLVFRRVATADMPAAQTQAEMYPTVAHLEAFFAALGLGFDAANLIDVRAFIGHLDLLDI
jgi:hypothetical protein